jgi:glycosyltransferase involved in cell wall biosynthesis
MRVLLLHDPYKPVESGSIGGEDNIAQLEIDILSSRGHAIIDARSFDSGMARKLNQVRAQSFGSHGAVMDLIEASRPDVIHTHNLNQRSGYKWMESTNIPIVSSIHNYRLFCPSSIAWRSGKSCIECRDHSALRAVVHGCDGARGVLNASRHLIFQRDYPQVGEPRLVIVTSDLMAKVLAPLVDTSKFRILRSPGTITKNELSIERSGWIFAGRFAPEKGVLDLIRNWPANEKLDLAGDGPLREEIANEIVNKQNIKLIGTYPPGDSSIFLRYEGMVFPSTWYEGSPLVVMDCLGAGTPVICTDQSGAAEQISISKGGFVITGEMNESAIKIAQVKIRQGFSEFSNNALKAVESEFSLGKWGDRLEQYLGEAVD